MNNEQLVYWKSISELLKWKTYEKNSLILDILYKHKMDFEKFFNLSESGKKELFGLSTGAIEAINLIISQIPSIAFEIESLNKQGIDVITLNDEFYPNSLKNLLKKNAPTLMYTKGNKALLNEQIAAIVGSRDVSEKGILFTQNIAKRCVKKNLVISSGYARGVDKIALETALKCNGKSIAVIPQGIMTFKSDLKKLYVPIIEGKVLVMSIFPPNAPWTVGRAMERNKYIYSLAESIYVAETGSEGGTWSGAIEGLKAKQDVYVRYAEHEEKCANNKLIALGAKPLDMGGNILDNIDIPLEGEAQLEVKLPEILKVLEERSMTASQMIEMFELKITSNLLVQKLKKISSLHVTTKNSTLLFDAKKGSEFEQLTLV